MGILFIEIERVIDRKWNPEKVIVFKSVILQRAQGVNYFTKIRKHIFFDSIYGIVDRLIRL